MTTNRDGAWELPHEFRQMQETARHYMRERVIPAEKPLPHDAIALPDEALKPRVARDLLGGQRRKA